MASISISYTIITLIFEKFNGNDNENFRLISLYAGVTFSILICVSRVYLGMHSILDVSVGVIFSYILSMGFLMISENLYNFINHSLINGFIIYSLVFMLGFFYPITEQSKNKQSTARSDTFLILGNY